MIEKKEILMSRTVFTNVQVLDGTGNDPIAGQVLVEGNRIRSIARDGTAIDAADAAFDALCSHPLGADAARIGVVTDESAGLVVADTAIGGSRIVDMLSGEQLPRIC